MVFEGAGADDFARRWSEGMREGKSPQDFLFAQVTSLRATTEKEQGVSIGVGDIAYLAQFWIDQHVITVDDVKDPVYLRTLGLTADEANVFVPKTLPEIKEFMREEQSKEEEKAVAQQKEGALQFCQHWGLERLDQIATYFQKNQTRLNKVNPNWSLGILRYQNQRIKLKNDLEQIIDPFEKARFLMRQAYYLTFFHPSELEQIFRAELESGSYPYLDSLLDISVTMYQNTSGKDPDFDNVHISSGNIGVTMSVFRVDDPDSMRRLRRQEAMESLIFGAKTPTETTGIMKKQFKPFQRRDAQIAIS